MSPFSLLRNAALLFLLASGPVLSQTPLPLANSGFENGLTGWTVNVASSTTATISEEAASMGKKGLRVTRSLNAPDEIVSPRAAVTPGKLYLLHFWISGFQAGNASVEMVFFGAKDTPLQPVASVSRKKPRTYVGATDAWTLVELGAVAPEGAAALALRIKPGAGTQEGAVDFDDLQIEETTEPLPAPTANTPLPTDTPRIQELKAEIQRNPTRGKPAPKIVLKLDDLKPAPDGVSPQWQRVADFARERNIKLALGIIAQSMETGSPAFFDWVKQQNAAGRIEFWNHGYDHAAGEGTVREFFNQPYAYQKEHLSRANQLAREKLGFPFVSFGAPFNQTDAATIQALSQEPDIKVWIYGDPQNSAGKTVLHRSPVTIETGARPDFQAFLEAYAHNRGQSYFIMQGHAGGWRDDPFEQFRLIVDFLIGQKVEFVFPRDLAGEAHIVLRSPSKAMSVFSTAVPNPFVLENRFLAMPQEIAPLPTLAESKIRLPSPFWAGHDSTIACYWKAWELAFGNLRQPGKGSPLIANFIDTAFNNATFMWDSAFMTMFGRYGRRTFCFQRTLDNFYARQHCDGYISREIRVADGSEAFERYDLSSTGPNIMPWAEWEYYRAFGDKERLAAVFPVLVAYTQWFRRYRSWPDGTYFSCGLGTGMDNQPRQPQGYDHSWEHGHMAWIDITLQQIFADQILLQMAAELGRESEIGDLREEAGQLTQVVNRQLWDEDAAFYFDRYRDGRLSGVKTIGAYWALLAGVVPPQRMDRFLGHLDNPAEFNRPHRVPSLSADHPAYDSKSGDYWRGGVWAPTNYMVLRGLTSAGANGLAHEIALNHVRNVVETFEQTGTVWENYAPESAARGNPAKADFVGWSGLAPIAVLFEYVFGLRPDAARNKLVWDVRLLEAHGVERYPFGPETSLNLRCAARASDDAEPQIEISGNRPVTLICRWGKHEKTVHFAP